MKKILVMGLLFLTWGCGVANAITPSDETELLKHCPPVSALNHEAPGAQWTMNDTYKKVGWYVSNTPWADLSTLTSIHEDAWMGVRFTSSQDKDFLPDLFVSCEYDVSFNALPRHLIVTLNTLFKDNGIPPVNFERGDNKPYGKSTYECNTSSAKSCAWDNPVK